MPSIIVPERAVRADTKISGGTKPGYELDTTITDVAPNAENLATAPTLAELFYPTFISRDQEVNQEILKSFLSNNGRGEITSSVRVLREKKSSEAVPDGCVLVTLVENGYRLFKENGVWRTEFDARNSFDTFEPPPGWVVEYDPDSGYPLQTKSAQFGRKEAVERFGALASYFIGGGVPRESDPDKAGVRLVYRRCSYDPSVYGPFEIGAFCTPERVIVNGIGLRSIRRGHVNATIT